MEAHTRKGARNRLSSRWQKFSDFAHLPQSLSRAQRVSKETLDLFQMYPWPGNVRELQNVIERPVIVCESESFSVDESWLSRQPLPAPSTTQLELRRRLAAQEREAIEAALSECRGRVFGPSGAAAKLGIARSTLESKIRTLKIDKNRFKVSTLIGLSSGEV